MVTKDKMDEACAQLYGAPDLALPPSTGGVERPWLQCEAIANAAGIKMPELFFTVGKGARHIGGDSCFACMHLAQMFGFKAMWYVHPADRAAPPGTGKKPFGRKHLYLHQVLKCGYALALAHRVVRCDRDAGRGEVNAHILSERPFSG
jgi:hypothetical protein